MSKPSPSKNPFVKQLTFLEMLRYYAILQRPKPRASQDSLLLALPPEIRNRIYELVLIEKKPINVDTSSYDYGDNDLGFEHKPTIKEPPLLRTCHTFRAEATQLYYNSNIFTCYHNDETDINLKTPNLVRWIWGLGSEKCAMLKHVRPRTGQDKNPNHTWSLPYNLAQIESLESALERMRCPLSQGVIHTTVGADTAQDAVTTPELKSLMEAKHWEYYEFIKKDMDETNVLLTCWRR